MASDITLAVGDGARRMTYAELAQARCAIALTRAALPTLTEAPENLYIVLNALACLSAELIAGHSNRLDFFHLALGAASRPAQPT